MMLMSWRKSTLCSGIKVGCRALIRTLRYGRMLNLSLIGFRMRNQSQRKNSVLKSSSVCVSLLVSLISNKGSNCSVAYCVVLLSFVMCACSVWIWVTL